MYFTVHVDDGFNISSSPTIVNEFMEAFLTYVHKAVLYHDVKLYLGLDITRSNDGSYIYVSQERYIDEHYSEDTRVYKTPMPTKIDLRAATPNVNNASLLPLTGELRYLADRTRADILVALGEVSTGGATHPSDDHVATAERIKCYLTNTKHYKVRFGGNEPVHLFGYCDAAYIAIGNCKSRLGSCLFLNYDSGAISTVSRNDTTVSHSSTEAEIKAIDMICREIVYVRSLLAFMGYEQTKPTKVFVDNRSAIELCRTLKVSHKVRHVNVRIHYIRELINARIIELVFIPSEFNVADVLTKALHSTPHERHTKVLLQGHNNNDDGILMSVESYDSYMCIVDNKEATCLMLSELPLPV